MAKKNNFTTVPLNQLIASYTGDDIDDLANDITKYDSEDIVPATSPEITNMVEQNTGGSVDFKRVYAQLEKLIENANNALDSLDAFDPDTVTADVFTARTGLINAINKCIQEFTKIHLTHIKFQQKLQLEQIQQANREKILKQKSQLYNKGKNIDTTVNETLIPVGSDDVLKFIRQQLQQQQAENQLK